MRTVGKILGYPVDDKISHRKRGFWKDNLEYVLSEIDTLTKSLNKFPKAKEVQDYDHSLYYAITKYYNGLPTIRYHYYNKLNGK